MRRVRQLGAVDLAAELRDPGDRLLEDLADTGLDPLLLADSRGNGESQAANALSKSSRIRRRTFNALR